MLNRKYFPFERNSYYFGKLLTAKDFESEQQYLNDKRRFINRLMGGNGIVSGLGVVMADDTSLILQAGCAFDASGREIVVPETKVVKLSTIEGYDALTTSGAYLAISYEEQSADEVYASMHGEKGGDKFNRVREGYKLSLLDESLAAKPRAPLDEFVKPLTVYSDSEVTVTQHTPCLVPKDSDVNVYVEIKKTGLGAGEYSLSYTLETPGFTTPDGDGMIAVSMNAVKLMGEESAQICFTLVPKQHIWGGGDITVTVSDFAIQKNGESFSLNERLQSRMKPLAQGVDEYYINTYYQMAMDKKLTENYDEMLWIAKIALFRQKSEIIIDRVYAAPFRQYAYSPRQLMRLRELERFYPGAGKSVRQTGDVQPGEHRVSTAPALPAELANQTACGVFDLGLGLGYNTKDPVFSEEIMHGLGKGPIYVEVGIEHIMSDEIRNVDDSEIILGDARLFDTADIRPHENERIYNVSTAVKVLPGRGTFIVAALPRQTSGLISLRIRWFAMRVTEVGKKIRSGRDTEKYILINPDTIVVAPKGTAHISPVFINMPTEACSFKLIDAEGGSVDNNGVYTAPAKEGVYEIRVEAISDPSVFTHAFAIVTQKKKDAAAKAGDKK